MMSRDKMMHGFAARREQLMERAEETRDMLSSRAEDTRDDLAQRAERIREQFAENVTQDVVTNFMGWTLVSTGIAWGVTDWMKGRRMLRSMIGPIVLLVLGTAVLGGSMALRRRGMHIDEAEERVREELHSLDPFARLRVLRDVAEETVPFVRHISIRN